MGGGNHSAALSSDGNIYTWGQNGSGELGDGTTVDSVYPVAAETPQRVLFSRVLAASGLTMAVALDGNRFRWTTYAWGDNTAGQLRDGTTVSRAFPGPIVVEADAPVNPVDPASPGNSGSYAELAKTGVDPLSALTPALALLLIGGAVMLRSRIKRTQYRADT